MASASNGDGATGGPGGGSRRRVRQLALSLPPGRLDVELAKAPEDGACVVVAIASSDDRPSAPPSSLLRAGDVIESLNGTAMADVPGGVGAWRGLLDVTAGGTRTAIVRRDVGAEGAPPPPPPAKDVAFGGPAGVDAKGPSDDDDDVSELSEGPRTVVQRIRAQPRWVKALEVVASVATIVALPISVYEARKAGNGGGADGPSSTRGGGSGGGGEATTAPTPTPNIFATPNVGDGGGVVVQPSFEDGGEATTSQTAAPTSNIFAPSNVGDGGGVVVQPSFEETTAEATSPFATTNAFPSNEVIQASAYALHQIVGGIDPHQTSSPPSVAIHGDIAVIGAPDSRNGGNGKAFVLARDAFGDGWNMQARLVRPEKVQGRGLHFGYDVAVFGDTVVVGDYSSPCSTDFCTDVLLRCQVFVRRGGNWEHQAELAPPADEREPYMFGHSVDLYEDTALVGARADEGEKSTLEVVYVFVRSGDVWDLQGRLMPPDEFTQTCLSCHFSVSIYGDTAVLGRGTYDDVHVFVRNDAGVWSRQAELAVQGGRFGRSVDIYQDTIAVGDYEIGLLPGSENWFTGEAHLFVRNGSTWTSQGKVIRPNGRGGDYFGISVSVYGNVVVVGAYGTSQSGEADAGSAYMLVRDGSVWVHKAVLVAPDAIWDDHFGAITAINGRDVIISSSSGKVYAFRY